MRSIPRSAALRILPLALLVVGGCSLLTDLSISQCETTSDCLELGSAFADTVCEASRCVTRANGGSGGNGPSTGGLGGSGQPECETNGECIDENFGSPYICRDERCIALTVPGECPVVLGAGQDLENLREPSPLIFGAYSYVDPTAPRLSVPTLNYELAIDEINSATRGGLPGGPNGSLRPFIAVVCSGTDSPDLEKSLGHLIDTLEVPAIISSLYTRDLLEAFQTKGKESNTFFLSPLEADTTLTQLQDDGLLWHMLASARDLSPAYVPLVAQTEAYLRTERGLDTIKVALVDSKTPFLTDIADDLIATIEFNGKTALQNETDDNFLRVRIDSQLEVPNPDISAALSDLEEFRPDIVLAVASSEFIGLLNSLETQWPPTAGERPFYLVSPYLFGQPDLANTMFFSSVHERLLGVNFSGAEDTTLYDLYLSKLKSTYSVEFPLEGSENFYDAAYFLMYSIAGAGNPPRLTGAEVALGMTRLVSGQTTFDVGNRDVNNVIGYLRGSPGATFSLQGTMGPPSFNTGTGARRGHPSIYCINSSGEFVQNAMTFDADQGTLSGDPPCIENFPN